MNPELQTFVALALVALAAVVLVRKLVGRRRQPGCGSACDCRARKLSR